MKTIFKIILTLVVVIALLLGGGVAWLSVTEYRPDAQEEAPSQIQTAEAANPKETLSILSWNTGYAGLDEKEDFFMDGGTMVNPISQQAVEENMEAIRSFLAEQDADFFLLQEVDRGSSRTEKVDQLKYYDQVLDRSWAYGVNYRCKFVPYPMPPLGTMETGVVTMTDVAVETAPQRISLPCPFSWPTRTANMKRCMVLTRHPLEGTDKELVVVNFHLEAYDDGEGKLAQTQLLIDTLEREYEAGNYVVAGGDFNQTFPGSVQSFPIKNPDYWVPGELSESDLPEGWHYICDNSCGTCRLLNQPYDPEDADSQLFVIDGFIVSPNVRAESVEAIDLNFKNSDHNPVKMEFSLIP